MVEMIQTGFMRQRRQLVIISAALFLYEIAEIRFTEFNIFGNKIEVDNPETISICIWVLFFYWLVRYYQYFRDLPNKRIIKSIENQVITRCNKIGKNSLKSKETRKKYFSKVGVIPTFVQPAANQPGKPTYLSENRNDIRTSSSQTNSRSEYPDLNVIVDGAFSKSN